jgi:cellulose biosynthesis protein BcsQ
MNKKGGCAKTATVMALAVYAAKMRSTSQNLDGLFRVLYWDMDEQNTLSKRIGWEPVKEKEGTGTFLQWILPLPPDLRAETKKNLIHPFRVKNKGVECAIIPAGGPDLLRQVEIRIDNENKRGNYNWFKDLVEELAHYFDLIVFDTGPSRNALHRLVSSVSDEVIIPFDGLEAFQGIGDLISELKAEDRPDNANITLVMTKWQPQKRGTGLVANPIYKKAKEIFPEFLCTNGVRESMAMKRAFNVPLMYREFDPEREYQAVVEEILQRWEDPGRPNFFDYWDNGRMAAYEQAIGELKEKQVLGGIEFAGRIEFRDTIEEDEDANPS